INYDFPAANFVSGTLHITKAHLTVTANPESVQYSDPLLTSTWTLMITGFQNGENEASLRASNNLSGQPSFTTSAAITFYMSTGGVSNAPGIYSNAIIPYNPSVG